MAGRATRLGRIGPTLLAALLLSGCVQLSESSAPGEPAVLHIVNVDGPDVSVLLGASVVALVACGGDATLVPGPPVGALPWDVVVRADDGAILGSVSILGPLPQGLLIRGRALISGSWPMSYGPAPSPLDAPCGTAVP